MASFAGDNNLGDLWFGATSQNGAHAEGWFANAKIARAQTSGDDPLTVQANILAALASLYPSVTLRRGLEISFNPKHSNWFGGSFHQPVYGTDLPVGADATLQATKLIHGYGGLASVNHPFGVKQNDGASSTGSSTQSALDTAGHKLAVKLLKNKCYGADLLEAGYHSRGKTGTVAKLEDHLALWDTLSRNAVFLTGNGVSDNHTGHVNGWSVDAGFNTFQTTLWAASTGEADLLDALRAGRGYCAEILIYTGQLWLQVDANPMGSVSVASATSRPLSVTATSLPSTGVIEVVRGPVDYAGTASPDPATTVVATLAASAFASTGSATVTIDTSTSCFVRVNLLDTSLGRRTAFSNPIWLLRATPPGGIPAARLAPDTTA